jgi:CheY-like chemotaxis protein
MLVEGVIHRINNPLASLLLGLVELSEQLSEIASDERRREVLRIAQEARMDGERVASAVRELRALFPADAPRRVAPHGLLADVAALLEQYEEGSISIERRFGALLPVFVREARFAQVLRSAGQLAIAALRGQAESADQSAHVGRLQLYIEAHEQPGKLLLRLGSLEGGGASMQALSGPLAVRLSLLRGMLQQLGGSLEVGENALSLTLPVDAPVYDSEQEVDLARRTSVPPRGEMRILVVDDEPSIHRALRRGLIELGHVQAVHSTASAVELLQGGATFDVILADLVMPGGTGLDLFDWLGREAPKLKRRMILMTGLGETYTDSHPDVVVVSKPFDLPALRELVCQVATRA